jgi:RNA polymerase sigma-70 factor (ECF subfamily)
MTNPPDHGRRSLIALPLIRERIDSGKCRNRDVTPERAAEFFWVKDREMQQVRRTQSEMLAADERNLIDDLYPSLRSFASVVIPPGEDGNYLVQEALFRALRRNGSLIGLKNPGAYVRRIIVNLARDRLRSEYRRRSAWSKLEPVTPAPPEYSWELEELRSVSPKARAVLYLRVIEGWPYADIGKMLDCSQISARVAASRGKQQLQELLAKEVRDATA